MSGKDKDKDKEKEKQSTTERLIKGELTIRYLASNPNQADVAYVLYQLKIDTLLSCNRSSKVVDLDYCNLVTIVWLLCWLIEI